jgi:hypothetical protein
LTGKPEGKRPLGRPRRRWKGDIKPDCKKERKKNIYIMWTEFFWTRIRRSGELL